MDCGFKRDMKWERMGCVWGIPSDPSCLQDLVGVEALEISLPGQVREEVLKYGESLDMQ